MSDKSHSNDQDVLVQKSRVMYLDIDDTLLVWTKHTHGFAAPMAKEFLEWALEHFEVRWLTMWCPSGHLSQEGAEELSYRFNYKVDPTIFKNIKNPLNFVNYKTEAIDFNDPRPWVWVEDGIMYNERSKLRELKVDNNFYKTNVSENHVALQVTWRRLADAFNLPNSPTGSYKTELDIPITPITVDELINRFRSTGSVNHDNNITSKGWDW